VAELLKPVFEGADAIKDLLERESFLARKIADLQFSDPGLADEAFWTAEILRLTFESALDKVLAREGLTNADKSEARSDADEFWAWFEGFRSAPHVRCESRIVFRFALTALLTGLYAGLNPDEVKKLRAGLPGRVGGARR
jgi:hypothetical protein